MKRYIRTKGGRIIDITKTKVSLGYHPKEADTIEELIEVGDLVKFGGTGSHTFVSSLRDKTTFYDYYGAIKDKQYIMELYTKQGNDFILVAKKENGKWRVI